MNSRQPPTCVGYHSTVRVCTANILSAFFFFLNGQTRGKDLSGSFAERIKVTVSNNLQSFPPKSGSGKRNNAFPTETFFPPPAAFGSLGAAHLGQQPQLASSGFSACSLCRRLKITGRARSNSCLPQPARCKMEARKPKRPETCEEKSY